MNKDDFVSFLRVLADDVEKAEHPEEILTSLRIEYRIDT